MKQVVPGGLLIFEKLVLVSQPRNLCVPQNTSRKHQISENNSTRAPLVF